MKCKCIMETFLERYLFVSMFNIHIQKEGHIFPIISVLALYFVVFLFDGPVNDERDVNRYTYEDLHNCCLYMYIMLFYFPAGHFLGEHDSQSRFPGNSQKSGKYENGTFPTS